jgi:hypothetical protein
MKITEIYLQTSKPSEVKDFYKSTLELETKSDTPGKIEILAGNTKIIFERSNEGDPIYHFAFNIPSNKIDEAYKWLNQRVELLWMEEYESYIADFKNWNGKSVYFIDPAGNIVEFIARFDLHDEATSEFSSKQIRNVSEIGLVFPENSFDKKVCDLLTAYELSYFNKQPPLDKFRAIGNDEGLFICVPEGRPWYPTSSSMAGCYPMKILFDVNEKEFIYVNT